MTKEQAIEGLELVRDAVEQNGGLIDADDTCDGKQYVMITREAFDKLEAFYKDAARKECE